MKTGLFDVSYFDTLRGGSGSVRMKLDEVPGWLAANNGYLIRRLDDLDNWMREMREGIEGKKESVK